MLSESDRFLVTDRGRGSIGEPDFTVSKRWLISSSVGVEKYLRELGRLGKSRK